MVSIASLRVFFKSQTVAFVNGCKKVQLLELADHYDVVVADKSCKEELRRAVL